MLIFFGLVFIGLPIAYSNGGTIDQFHERLPLSFFDIGGWGWAIIIPMALSIILSFFVAMDGFLALYGEFKGDPAAGTHHCGPPVFAHGYHCGLDWHDSSHGFEQWR